MDGAPAIDLEIITRKARGRSRPTPLIFVHGANVGAWCWDQHFLPYFAAHGYNAHALSLRGHAGSGGSLGLAGLDDYVDDLAQAVAGLAGAPVVIGHSMGGCVVQRYIESHSAAAAVLMASVPPQGVWQATMSLALRDPTLFSAINLLESGCPDAEAFRTLARALFSEDLPREQANQFMRRMQAESKRAIFDMLWIHLRSRSDLSMPALVLGAQNDALFPPEMIVTAARAYAVEAEILPAMGHAMMWDTRWRAAAERILAWLGGLKL
jgi:non-heme chloroperoxidase